MLNLILLFLTGMIIFEQFNVATNDELAAAGNSHAMFFVNGM